MENTKTKNEEEKIKQKKYERSLSDFCLEDIHSLKNNNNNGNDRLKIKIEINKNILPNVENIDDTMRNNNNINIIGGNEKENKNNEMKNNFINIEEDKKKENNKKVFKPCMKKKCHKSKNKYQMKSNKFSLDNFATFNDNKFENQIKIKLENKPKNNIIVNKKHLKTERKPEKGTISPKKEKSVLNTGKFLFENINIFNSLLIMMNNISFINDYLLKDKTKCTIKNCESNNKYCLSSILYYMNKKMWNYVDESKISTNILSEKYLEFMDCFKNNYCISNNKLEYCYDIKNTELIINFIYDTINKELTSEYHKSNNSHNRYEGKDNLSIFLNNFTKNNNSKISDHFIGCYENKEICTNCQNNYFSINKKNKCNYSSFYLINFNLTEIREYLKNNNNNYNFFNNSLCNNNDISINLNSCFDYTFFHNFKRYQSYCNRCYFFTQKYNYNSIFSLSSILTIILSENNNYNFIIEDELDLKQYLEKNKNNCKYLLVSVLCQICYNKKFRIYCINPNDGLWYYYSDNRVVEVQSMDKNAEPLVLIYQRRDTICYEYKNIKREENKIMLDIKFNNLSEIKRNFPEIKRYFKSDIKIKEVIQKIRSINNIGESKIVLLINGKKANDDEILSNIISNNRNVTAMIN